MSHPAPPMDADEKKPLLNAVGGIQAEATPTAPPIEPPPYEEPSIPGILAQYIVVCTLLLIHTAPYAPGTGPSAGLPPPYAAHAPVSQHTLMHTQTLKALRYIRSPLQMPGSGQSLFVQCRVCQHVIHVAPGTQSRVVKCTNCREATVSFHHHHQ